MIITWRSTKALFLSLVLLASTSSTAEEGQDEATAADAATASAPFVGDLGITALNWAAPRVYLYPNFLDDEEVAHLISYARGSKVFKEADRKAAAAKAAGEPPPGPYLTSVYFDWNAIYTDPIVNRVEQRIAVVTGMPPHKHEEPINVHRIRTVATTTAGGGDGAAAASAAATALEWPQNRTSCVGKDCPRKVTSIHHDKVQKEHSSVTVLVYLNDVAEGGGTIFPCLSVPPANASGGGGGESPEPVSVSEACSEAFDAGARWFDGSDTTVKGRPKKLRTPTVVDDELQAILWAAHLGCHEPPDHLPAATKAQQAGGGGGGGGGGSGGGDNDHGGGGGGGGGGAGGAGGAGRGSSAAAAAVGATGEVASEEKETAAVPFAGWKRKPIRAVPKKGSAIVFFHTHPNGTPDPYAWHAGCLPISNEKWTMQKFKEMPMQWR